KNAVAEGGRRLLRENLTVGTWGNLSIRDPRTGLIYIKPSGIPYEEIANEDIVVMNGDFQIVEGHRKPSIEYQMHIAVLNSRPDVDVVIHSHPIYSSVLGVIREDLPGVSEDFVQIVGDRIVNCEYALPGTEELASNVVRALGRERNAVLIPNHGTVYVGKDFENAMKVVSVVEKNARIYIMAKSIGKPHLISDEDIKAMQDFVRTKYGQEK
ncbi:MAG TPA: class II aldolase/adducin family protein, partial [Sediminispirochaeta sp.]|nr:class II aldolase/adducin family protein [Sediminispirochaeta sp.]